MKVPAVSPASLDEWLALIEAGHPTEIELGLDRIRLVAQALDVLALPASRVVTVAGTNGKGSTVAYLAAMLQAAGYSVGTYTSPHFLRYNERVCFNGRPVDEAALCESFARVESARCQCDLSLTYFEYGTLAALDLFKRSGPDVVLLEVGLGGRLDAVNILDPDVSVLTTVALDHQDWLGDDREQIGYEKAGIFRSGVPAIYGEADIPRTVIDCAGRLGAPLMRWQIDFGCAERGETQWSWFGSDPSGKDVEIHGLPYPALPFENAATAIQAFYRLGLDVDTGAIARGIGEARLTGRCQQQRHRQRDLLLDVAHNPQAANHLAESLPPHSGQTWCVLGMLADKDSAQVLTALAPVVDRWCLGSLDVPRGQNAETLSRQLAAGRPAADQQCFDSVDAAFAAALAQSAPDDRVLVVGSFYTVAAVLNILEEAQ